MLQVYLVTHGEKQWNAARRIQGQSDRPLTAKGEHQAHLGARRVSTVGIKHVITSDLGRTLHTAQIVGDACGCTVINDQRLRDLHMGGWRDALSTA